MELRYPTTLPTVTVSIPDPQLGNVVRVESNAIVRRNRGGEIKSVDNWHDDIIQSFSIATMTRTQRDELENFLEVSAGYEIALSFNGEVWYGYIISPQSEIITIRDNCSYNVAFEFQGGRIS